MMEAAELNTLLIISFAIVAVTVGIIRLKKIVADFHAPLNTTSIVSFFNRIGVSTSVEGAWIVFDNKGKEYAINTSKLPILAIIKQTSLEGYHEDTTVLREVAQGVSLDTAMASIHVDGNPANRVIIQVNAIETCMGSFSQRLSIYQDIIEDMERRFFDEIKRR